MEHEMMEARTVDTVAQLQDQRAQVWRALSALDDVYCLPASTMTRRAWMTARNAFKREAHRITDEISNLIGA